MTNIMDRLRGLSKFNLTDDQKLIINSIDFDEPNFLYLAGKIRVYLKNGYPLVQLRDHWREIKALGNNSSSEEAFILRYGENIGKKLFKEKSAASTQTKDDYIKKYGEVNATEILSKRGASLKNYVHRHGEVEGKIRWEAYCDKRKNSYNEGKKQKKYKGKNLDWFQQKYGKVEGFIIWDAKRKKQAFGVSLDGYIQKYGEDEGRKRIKKSKSRGLDYYIDKHGPIVGRERFMEHYKKITNAKKSSVSKWSMECIKEIKKIVTDLKFYGENEIIIGLTKAEENNLNQKIVRPDLYYKKRIIEFNGDLFHANPKMFTETDTPHPFNDLTQREIRDIDNRRVNCYNERGWEVLEIWEKDYNDNKEKVIAECIQFLMKQTK